MFFFNPFRATAAISCLDMNGNDRNFATLLLPVLFLPAALLLLPTPPPVSQSLDWVLMTVTAGHSGRPRSQLGGGPARPLPHHIVPLTLGPLPPSHPVWWSCPQTPCSPPIPPHRSVQKCDSPPPSPPAPHCSVLCLCRAGPIPPYVVLISTQRPSVKTANYVATRAQFTLNPHMHRLCTDPCALRLRVVTHRPVKCARRRSNSLLLSVSGPRGSWPEPLGPRAARSVQ